MLLANPPSAVRIGLVATGVVLLVYAARNLLAGRRSPGDRVREGQRGMSGAVVGCAARLARRAAWLRRDGDASVLLVRVAMAPQSWPARIVAAGARHQSWEAELAEAMSGVRLLTALVGAVAGGTAYPLLGAAGVPLALVCGAVLGRALPDLVLAHAARMAQTSAAHNAATAIDVLAAAVGSGMGLGEALELTAGHAPPAVAAALRAAAVRTSTGADARAALTVEGTRYRVPALADVGAAVDRQRRLGAALGPELRTIAARLRSEERARIREAAARRGPLGTLVVALVIAPVCLAALTACLVGGLVESGGLGLR
jgi:Flp pilus assembly protein TadB